MDEKVEIRELQERVIAHMILLRMLVSREKMNDDAFEKTARGTLDEMLGKFVAEKVNDRAEMDTMFVQVRKQFLNIMDVRIDMFAKAGSDKPLTLRRRFLAWLERG